MSAFQNVLKRLSTSSWFFSRSYDERMLHYCLLKLYPSHLSLLKSVHQKPRLTTPGTELADSLKEYKYHMKKMSYLGPDTKNYVIPDDVLWLWHVHRLHPANYATDCYNSFGHIVPSLDKLHLIPKFTSPENQLHSELKIDLLLPKIESPLPNTDPTPPKFDPAAFPKKDLETIANYYQPPPTLAKSFVPSIDLVQGAFVQKRFVQRASKTLFNVREREMSKHAENYIKFLKLVPLVEKGKFLVPTMGIDFMWHTHMSAPELYLPGTVQIAGKFLNHHDTISDDILLANFIYTADLWQKVYKEEYGDPRCGSQSPGSTCCASCGGGHHHTASSEVASPTTDASTDTSSLCGTMTDSAVTLCAGSSGSGSSDSGSSCSSCGGCGGGGD